jgi:hypothetical protein
LIPPPKGYSWCEGGNPFEYSFNEPTEEDRLGNAAHYFSNYLLIPKIRDAYSSKRKSMIYEFAKNSGWSLDSEDGEKQALLDLFEGTNPMTPLVMEGTLDARDEREFKRLIQNRLRSLEKA